jgi:hypothetical protein
MQDKGFIEYCSKISRTYNQFELNIYQKNGIDYILIDDIKILNNIFKSIKNRKIGDKSIIRKTFYNYKYDEYIKEIINYLEVITNNIPILKDSNNVEQVLMNKILSTCKFTEVLFSNMYCECITLDDIYDILYIFYCKECDYYHSYIIKTVNCNTINIDNETEVKNETEVINENENENNTNTNTETNTKIKKIEDKTNNKFENLKNILFIITYNICISLILYIIFNQEY